MGEESAHCDGVMPAPLSSEGAARSWLAVLAVTAVTSGTVVGILVAAGLVPSSQVAESSRPMALSVLWIAGILPLVAACWLLVEDHSRSAIGLAWVGLAWLLPGLAAWPLLGRQSRAVLLAAMPLALAGCALVASGWRPKPTEPLRPAQFAVGFAVAAAVAHVLGYDPFRDPGCLRTCLTSPAALSDVLGPRTALGISVALSLVAMIAALVTIYQAQRLPVTMRIAGVLATVLFGTTACLPLARWGSTRAWAEADLVHTAGTYAIGLAAFLVALHGRRIRRRVRDLVEHLDGSARALPGVARSEPVVQFTVPGVGRWIDPAGRPVADAMERCAVLHDRDGPAVRLICGRRTDPGQILASITPAGRLALENARLHASGLARLADVQASQRQIVETTDLQRQRIERDLHDGAQQRLVAVSMHLSLARTRSDIATAKALSAADHHVRQALAALRELSHDSFATVLSTEGLTAAIEDLAAGSPLQVTIHVAMGEHPVPREVQMAAYVAVQEGLANVVNHSETDRAWVTLVEESGVLTVRVVDSGDGVAPTSERFSEAADRVGAVGGSFDISSNPGQGTILTARMPCAS